MMRKLFSILFVLSILSGCSEDDGVRPVLQTPVNEFCYGSNSDIFIPNFGYTQDFEQITATEFRTRAVIIDENLSLDSNNNLNGTGFRLDLTFIGNRNVVFQNGNYTIGNDETLGTAIVRYSAAFDPNAMINDTTGLIQGTVLVLDYATGYYIEIDGIDSNGDEFHGVYFGELDEL